jgi:PAS domain S-box-containing protein
MPDDAAGPHPRPGYRRPGLLGNLLLGLFVVLAAAAVATGLATSHRPWLWAMAAAASSFLGVMALAARRGYNHRYRSLLDRVPVGLYRTSPQGRIVDANPALARILGFDSPGALLVSPAQGVYVDPADRDQWVAQVDRATGPVEAELRMRRCDGDDIWVRDRVVPVRDRRGRVCFYEGELEDITQQRLHRKELEAALRSKVELIGTVSHELRTPLTSIVGYAQLLEQSLREAEPAEMAAVVRQQAEDVVDIVEDLLTAAQADAGTLRVIGGPLDLGDEVHRAVAGLAGRHTGSLDVAAEPLPAFGDPMRVRQVVRNLINNAIVHGGDHIRVATTGDGHLARVLVEDDGPGLTPGDEARVFEPFQRGSQGGAHGSVGLGLSISRQLARLMGGDLTYRREGNHTVFCLELPGRPSPETIRVPRPSVPVG